MNGYVTRKENTGTFNTFFCEGGTPGREAILFIHGSGPGANAESNWRRILPVFSDRYRVIALDLLGFGNSDHPENGPKVNVEWMAAWLEQIVELLDFLKIDRTNLVGNSLGGVISLHLTMEYPERVDKVTLMGSSTGGPLKQGPSPELAKLRSFWIQPSYRKLKNLTRWFVYDDSTLGDNLDEILKERWEMVSRPEVRRSALSGMFAGDPNGNAVPPSALRRMTNPFLLLHGVNDRVVPYEASLMLMEHLPNAQLHLYSQCGHWIQVEKRESFINKLTLFLEGKL